MFTHFAKVLILTPSSPPLSPSVIISQHVVLYFQNLMAKLYIYTYERAACQIYGIQRVYTRVRMNVLFYIWIFVCAYV